MTQPGLFNPKTRTVTNEPDVQRSFPVAALAPKVVNESQSPLWEKYAGPGTTVGVNNVIVLSKPAAPGSVPFLVESYVTATRNFTTGANGAGTGPPIRAATVEFTFNPADPNHGGNATLTNLDGFDHSTETWVVGYFGGLPDGTVSGQGQLYRGGQVVA
jgi:hypothetical protein